MLHVKSASASRDGPRMVYMPGISFFKVLPAQPQVASDRVHKLGFSLDTGIARL